MHINIQDGLFFQYHFKWFILWPEFNFKLLQEPWTTKTRHFHVDLTGTRKDKRVFLVCYTVKWLKFVEKKAQIQTDKRWIESDSEVISRFQKTYSSVMVTLFAWTAHSGHIYYFIARIFLQVSQEFSSSHTVMFLNCDRTHRM